MRGMSRRPLFERRAPLIFNLRLGEVGRFYAAICSRVEGIRRSRLLSSPVSTSKVLVERDATSCFAS